MGWFFNRKSISEIESEKKERELSLRKKEIAEVIKKWEHYLWLTKQERKAKDRDTLPSYWSELKGIEKVRWCYEYLKEEYLKDFKEWTR